MVRTTSKTTTTGMLAVLANATVTGGDVSAMFAGLGQMGRHVCRTGRQYIENKSCHPPSPLRLQPFIPLHPVEHPSSTTALCPYENPAYSLSVCLEDVGGVAGLCAQRSGGFSRYLELRSESVIWQANFNNIHFFHDHLPQPFPRSSS